MFSFLLIARLIKAKGILEFAEAAESVLQNYENFLSLSKFINEHFQWIEYWSIMQLEKFGFAKINWDQKFVDTSKQFQILDSVLSMSDASDLNIQLFNKSRKKFHHN